MDFNFHSTDWRNISDIRKDIGNNINALMKISDAVFIGSNPFMCKRVTIGNHE